MGSTQTQTEAPPGSTGDPAAEPSSTEADSPQLAQAREAFRLGSALARQGQWNEALAAFERSARLREHPVTFYNIGYVERALGHYTRARKNLRRSLENIERLEGSRLPDELVEEARGYLAELERKLARVAVTLEQAGTAIAVDGRPLERASEANAPTRPLLIAGTREPAPPEAPPAPAFDLLVDPGQHVFVLSREGARDTMVTHKFDPGASTALTLSAAADESSIRSASPAVGAAPAAADQSVTMSRGPDRTWMWVAYGVGAAGVVAGSVFGILAIAKDDDLEGKCDNNDCPGEYEGDMDRLKLYANLSTAGFAVGLAGAAIGTYLVLFSSDEASETAPEKTARVRPRVPMALSVGVRMGVGSVGVAGRF